MWTVEVHNERMQQAIEDEQAVAKARKYGNSIPRHNCQGSTVSVIVALASAGLLIANHVRMGPASLLSRLCKRVWDDGQQKEDTPAAQRKKVLSAAEARKKKKEESGSQFSFPARGSSGASASTTRVAASTTVDQSFAQEADATAARTGKANKKKSNKKKGKR